MEPRNSQENNAVGWVVGIVILAALLLGIYYLVHKNASPQPAATDAGSSYFVSIVQVKHQFKDGKDIYAGSLDLPNPCYSVDANVSRMQGATSTNLLALTTSQSSEEQCAQVVTSKPFRAEVTGSSSTATVEGTLNGKSIQLNVFEVPANKNIDQVDIDTKG